MNIFTKVGAFVVAALTSSTALAAELPNLNGKEVVVVTENAYPPWQVSAR